jgi:hypothetical protein
LENKTAFESQNDTSLTQDLQKEQLTTDTNMTNNQTVRGGGGTTNETTNATANQTETEGNQTAKNP